MLRIFYGFILALCFAVSAHALTMDEVNKLLTSGDKDAQQFAIVYLTVVVKSIHDVDMFAQQKGMIRIACVSDGHPISDESAALTAKEIWNVLIQDAIERDDEGTMSKDVTVAYLEWTQRAELCGPAI